jgi:predicted permease
LALGITAAITFFTIVYSVLLRPLPYKDSEHLVTSLGPVLVGDFRDIQQENNVFGVTALFEPGTSVLTIGEHSESLVKMSISPEFFPMLGVAPASGRSFLRSEYQPGSPQVVILSEALWAEHFGSDPNIPGKTVELDSRFYVVAGVMPGWFRFRLMWRDDPVSIWAPLALTQQQIGQRGEPRTTSHGFARDFYATGFIAHLKSGVSVERAQADLDGIVSGLISQHPEDEYLRGRQLITLKQLLIGPAGNLLWPLLAGAGLLLFIGCVNVAGLTLVRQLSRIRDTAIRLALGAGRGQLIRDVLAENLLITLGGTAIALPVSFWAVTAFKTLAPMGEIPRLGELRIDGRALGFVLLVIILLSSIVSGLVPAVLSSRPNLNSALKGNSLSDSRRNAAQARRMLLVTEVAVAVVLLIGAELMARSLWLLSSVNLGFDGKGVIQVSLQRKTSPLKASSSDPAQNLALFRDLLAQVSALPGSAYCALDSPGFGAFGGLRFSNAGQANATGADLPLGQWQEVTPAYFKTLDISIVRGRPFTASDVRGTQPVIIVNETLARQYFGLQDAIGQYLLYFRGKEAATAAIVGVAGDTRWGWLDGPQMPEIYTPLLQDLPPSAVLYIRSKLDSAVTPDWKGVQMTSSAELTVQNMAPLDELVSRKAFARPRFRALLLSVFAGLALLLTVVGIYGAFSYAAGLRVREAAIRIALGARGRDLVRPMLIEAGVLGLVGSGIGTAAALSLTRLIRTWLYGVAPTDAAVFATAVLVLATTCVLASYFAARKALRVDPAIALRTE